MTFKCVSSLAVLLIFIFSFLNLSHKNSGIKVVKKICLKEIFNFQNFSNFCLKSQREKLSSWSVYQQCPISLIFKPQSIKTFISNLKIWITTKRKEKDNKKKSFYNLRNSTTKNGKRANVQDLPKTGIKTQIKFVGNYCRKLKYCPHSSTWWMTGVTYS